VRILIAPDKFKGSLEAADVAAHLAAGLRQVAPALEVNVLAVADGGEGTVDAALRAGFLAVEVPAAGPLGDPVRAQIAVGSAPWASFATPQDRIGVVEMAAASGLAALPRDASSSLLLAPLTATSRGTGDMVRAALAADCTLVVLGVGGSAGTDGGAGMISALGARLLDVAGDPVPGGGGGLGLLDRVDLDGLDPRVAATRFLLAADVTNPLTGTTGAAAVFGPQKGATGAEIVQLDGNLARLRDCLIAALGDRAGELALAPGAGAAGGVGYAALTVLGAERRPGIDVVLELVGLAARLAGADLVITGEGSLDQQSLGGKTPVGVARLARGAGVPVVAVCGRTTLTRAEAEGAGFSRVYALTDLEPDPARCMSEAGPLLQRVGSAIAATLRITPA
jgi:glycerate kinase